MPSGIYRIEVGPHFYYGSSKDLDGRRRKHLSHLRKGVHGNARMQNAWNKYQEFSFVPILECSPSDLLSLEQGFLDQFYDHPHCMNLLRMAGSALGYRHTPETIAKMRVPKSSAHSARMSGNTWGSANKGRTLTPEAIEANRRGHLGLLQSEETKQKRRDTWARKKAIGMNKNGPNRRTTGRQTGELG